MSKSRIIAYSAIAILILLAIRVRGEEAAPVADDYAAPVVRVDAARAQKPLVSATSATAATTSFTERAGMRAQLFNSPPPVAPVPAPAEPAAAPVLIEPKLLGWMTREGVPYVFVEYNGDTSTLTSGEDVEGTWRFDGVGGGFARFTYLPNQTEKQYPVSDPATLD